MEMWFYAKDDEKKGPVGEAELKTLLAQGQLSGDSLVWTKGMGDWQPAAQVAALGGDLATDSSAPGMPVMRSVLAPTTVSVGAVQPASSFGETNWAQQQAGTDAPEDVHALGATGPQRRPWLRWVARSIDFTGFCLLTGVAIGLFAPTLIEGSSTLLGYVLLFLYTFVDAAMLSNSGTTFGKWLLNIRVCNKDGSKLSYGAALSRSMEVWLKGFGLGFPLVSLFTQLYSYNQLVNKGATPWDNDKAHVVVHGQVSTGKAAVAIGAFTMAIILMVMSNGG